MSTDDKTCLVIDTTNRWVITGLFSRSKREGSAVDAPRESFNTLLPEIGRLLENAKVNRPSWIACAVGPGSFTGSRIGVSVARDLAQIWGIPVLGFDSLAAYGAICRKALLESSGTAGVPGTVDGGISPRPEYMAVAVDGKQKRLYVRIWDLGLPVERYHEGEIHDIAPAELPALCPGETLLFVDDRPSMEGYLKERPAPSPFPSYQMMPHADPGSLYEYALLLGGIEKAGGWEQLHVHYVRTDPAHQKYPAGFNRT